MSAVQIPEEFTIWVCYVALALYCARTHAYTLSCIHDASGQRDGAEQITAYRLPVFQRKDNDRVCGRVTRCSISSFVTAGLWPRSGYWTGVVSSIKQKVMHWHREDRVKVVVITGWSSTGCHCIFKTFHRCFVNIYRYGFKSPARNWDLKSMSFVHIVTSILVTDSFFLLKLFVSIIKYFSSLIYFYPLTTVLCI